MIIFTDSKNLKLPLEQRVEECINKYSPNAIYLREKHLSEEEYLIVLKKVKAVCDHLNTPIFVCHHFAVAQKLGVKNLHLSFEKLQELKNAPDFCKVFAKKSLLLDESYAVQQCGGDKSKMLFQASGTAGKFLQREESAFNLSVAVHNVEEAKQAQKLGVTCLVFGHIFETDCKKGLTPRGLERLAEIVKSVDIPVVAIGGINSKNFASVLKAGAYDFATMSSGMNLNF